METKLRYLDDLMFNLKVWRRDLKSQKKQIRKFERKIEEISARNFEIEAKQGIESFQNRIIRENEVIDQLLHRINVKMDEVKNADKSLNIDGTLKNRQRPLSDEMKIFVKLHYELKEDMMDFFLRWL